MDKKIFEQLLYLYAVVEPRPDQGQPKSKATNFKHVVKQMLPCDDCNAICCNREKLYMIKNRGEDDAHWVKKCIQCNKKTTIFRRKK